ncbi:carbon-nitrogen hydrolase family protein [Planctomycetota bacterium]
MKISLIQMHSTDKEERNLEICEKLIEEAVSQGTDLITLPETFHWIGPEHEKPLHSTPVPGPVSEFLSSFASKHQVYIHGGSILEQTEDKCANTTLFFAPDGTIQASYRKIHLFDAEINGTRYFESEVVLPGTEPVTVTLENLTYGFSICYDLRFPELYRKLSQKKADIIFSPAAFTVPTGKAHWETLIRARAIENQVFMAAAAQAGTDSTGKSYYGHSMLVDPWGTVLIQMDGHTEGCATMEIDPEQIKEVRRNLPVLDHRKLSD